MEVVQFIIIYNRYFEVVQEKVFPSGGGIRGSPLTSLKFASHTPPHHEKYSTSILPPTKFLFPPPSPTH